MSFIDSFVRVSWTTIMKVSEIKFFIEWTIIWSWFWAMWMKWTSQDQFQGKNSAETIWKNQFLKFRLWKWRIISKFLINSNINLPPIWSLKLNNFYLMRTDNSMDISLNIYHDNFLRMCYQQNSSTHFKKGDKKADPFQDTSQASR